MAVGGGGVSFLQGCGSEEAAYDPVDVPTPRHMQAALMHYSVGIGGIEREGMSDRFGTNTLCAFVDIK